MNHYVYKITNIINGKIYIGKRSCKCDIVDDSYIGSGTALKSAIKKYGIENFTKTILHICESDKEAYEIESVIVNIDFIKRTDTYNLCGGGKGSGVGECSSMFGKNHSDESKLKISNANIGKTHTEETKSKISMNHAHTLKGKIGELHHSFGKVHSEETRSKISTGNKGKTHSLETKAKISANNARPNLGKILSDKTKAKISANHGTKGKKQSQETIAKRNATRLINIVNKQIANKVSKS